VTSFDQIYGVNRVQQNRNGERMAPGIGRYPEDVYDGVSIQGRGNPWFLTTHAMAEYHYRLARALKRTGSLALTSKRLPFFKRLQMTSQSPFKGVVLRAGDRLVASQLVFQQLVQAVQEEGDAYMRRSLFHTKSGGDQSEQFNRESGFMQGAEHLTWSYVSFLTAVRAR
jgi:glucoamylase